jgi:anti-sigma factor RsiW
MTTAACEMIGARLSAYRDGALPPGAARDVAAHLRECSGCRARLAGIEAVARLVAGAALPAPPGFDERLRARLRAKGLAEEAWARRGRLARRASLLAAGLLVVLAAGLGPAIVRGDRSGPPSLSDEQNLNLVLFGTTDVEGAANPSPEGRSRSGSRSE